MTNKKSNTMSDTDTMSNTPPTAEVIPAGDIPEIVPAETPLTFAELQFARAMALYGDPVKAYSVVFKTPTIDETAIVTMLTNPSMQKELNKLKTTLMVANSFRALGTKTPKTMTWDTMYKWQRMEHELRGELGGDNNNTSVKIGISYGG